MTVRGSPLTCRSAFALGELVPGGTSSSVSRAPPPRSQFAIISLRPPHGDVPPDPRQESVRANAGWNLLRPRCFSRRLSRPFGAVRDKRVFHGSKSKGASPKSHDQVGLGVLGLLSSELFAPCDQLGTQFLARSAAHVRSLEGRRGRVNRPSLTERGTRPARQRDREPVQPVVG